MTRGELRATFEEKGFVGPLSLFDRRACRRLRRLLTNASPAPSWHKGLAASSRAFYEVAAADAIVDRVAELIGEDVILWGASLVRRRPGQVHPWHTDLETATEAGRTVTVWIGIQNTNERSSLMVVPYSHRFRRTVQQVAFEAGKKRGEAATEEILRWVRLADERCRVEQPAAEDGQALLFDGWLWHGSANTNRRATRTALLLQYATPDAPIRIPDAGSGYEWPPRFLDDPRPPCLLVRGTDRHRVNVLVPAPPVDPGGRTSGAGQTRGRGRPCWIESLPAAPEGEETGWRRHPIFRGSTGALAELGCHASVLGPGAMPHPPHRHAEEELIVMLSGAADVLVSEDGSPPAETAHRIGPGAFFYHAAFQPHTIRCVGPEPARYVVFKWRSEGRRTEAPSLPSSAYRFAEVAAEGAADPRAGAHEPMTRRRVLDAPTLYLDRLRSHLTLARPGAGYAAHRDPYDVALVLLEGSVETLGRRVGSPALVFYSAGELHGLRNAGPGPASYLVIELHGGGHEPRLRAARSRRLPRLWKRLRRLAGGGLRAVSASLRGDGRRRSAL